MWLAFRNRFSVWLGDICCPGGFVKHAGYQGLGALFGKAALRLVPIELYLPVPIRDGSEGSQLQLEGVLA